MPYKYLFRLVFVLLILGCVIHIVSFPTAAQSPSDAEGTKQTSRGSDPAQVNDPASAPDQIVAVPNRPTFSTTAESVESGVFEIEYGFEAGDGHQNINGLVKFGLTKKLELRFANNLLERDAGVAGLGDSGAGFKYKLFQQEDWRPTLSVLYSAIIPTAPAELGVGAVGHSAGILVSKDFGKNHFDFNETAQWLGRPGGNGFDRNYFTAVAYSHGISGKWGMTAEIAGFSRTNAMTPATMTIMGAAIYSISSRCILDGGIYVGAYGNLPRVTFFSGVTYSIGDLYHRRKGRGRKTD
jgi:hypothetical protein